MLKGTLDYPNNICVELRLTILSHLKDMAGGGDDSYETLYKAV